ncbi:unnamed protein product [Plutella xylostella]|uniref:(diamondback moth) hypothetical protein n=1 Tax=Plutella xylostella TaxID=51655 RepID=A0A8S4EXQ2_PLUXY|nr:unnamed protein product [Plutella xylostella]
MSTDEDGDKLKLFWDLFFKAETGTYEKSTWLDLFLAEFLIRLNEGGDPKELIKFCPISGVVTLVGCELLCGIHRVTSAINAHYTLPVPCLENPCTSLEDAPPEKPQEEEKADPAPGTGLFSRANAQSSTEILRNYLLSGVAWRCLILLKALGVEGLSCCRQLSSVLIWVCGELGAGAAGGAGGAGGARNPHVPVSRAHDQIYQLLENRIWSKQKLGSSQPKLSSSATKESASGRGRRVSQARGADVVDGPARRGASPDPSSDSGSDADLQLLNRSLTMKLGPPDRDFDYFTSPARDPPPAPSPSLYGDPFHSPRKTKPKAVDYMTDRHKDIINSQISLYEFTILVAALLQELCRADSSLAGAEGSQISVQCINYSLRNLCSLQFGAVHKYDAKEVSRIKVALTELLIVSLDKVLVRSDLCSKLITNGILPMILRILEDVICKSNSKYHKTDEKQQNGDAEPMDDDESENQLKFVFGISYSIVAFFYCLLLQCRSVEQLRQFTEQFRLYGECLKGALLQQVVALLARLPGAAAAAAPPLIKKLVEALGKLICEMKRVRGEVLHSAACARARHKACRARVAAGLHHHHDVLGEAGAPPVRPAGCCCVALLYGTLLALAGDEAVAGSAALRRKLLRVLLASGACCCVSAGHLMESMVRLMLTHGGAAPLALQVLERTVYGELGASVLRARARDQLPCAVCQPCDERRADFGKTKFYTYGAGAVERKSLWSFLVHYNSLLQLDNPGGVLAAALAHLLRATPRCRREVQHDLLFSVLYPSFIVAKHRYLIRAEESAYFLTVSCLDIFASLLNTVSFAEQFIQKGGLSYVLELVALPEFSKQCCSILEIAIIVEIFKMMKDNATEMSYYRDINSLVSVQMLLKSLDDATDKCYKIYKIKLPSDKFEELTDVSKELEAFGTEIERRDSAVLATRKASTAVAIKTSFAYSENETEDGVEDYIEVLRSVCTFWRCAAGLCLCAPLLRRRLAGGGALRDSYALLRLLLHALHDAGEHETRQLVKIIEALLTVQFALSEETSGRSKALSCSVVGGWRGGGAGRRALCEALLRVAAAAPSARLAMPPRDPPKVTILL